MVASTPGRTPLLRAWAQSWASEQRGDVTTRRPATLPRSCASFPCSWRGAWSPRRELPRRCQVERPRSSPEPRPRVGRRQIHGAVRASVQDLDRQQLRPLAGIAQHARERRDRSKLLSGPGTSTDLSRVEGQPSSAGKNAATPTSATPRRAPVARRASERMRHLISEAAERRCRRARVCRRRSRNRGTGRALRRTRRLSCDRQTRRAGAARRAARRGARPKRGPS